MQYDLNQLDHERFQRLLNAILTARFGERARLTPLRGPDGGSDGETFPAHPNMEFQFDLTSPFMYHPLFSRPGPGRYLFQAKYHRTGDQRLADLRTTVISEFRHALEHDVLQRPDREDVDHFFLITNVPASKSARARVDVIRQELLPHHSLLRADVWWGERVFADLDWAPQLWTSFPELFPGGTPPLLAVASTTAPQGLARALRLAIAEQHKRESTVKFRQIELEQQLLDLFVDLDVALPPDTDRRLPPPDSALQLLLDDSRPSPRLLLEGGPGQGKSTLTQMAAQIYREKILGDTSSDTRDQIWHRISRPRVPIRLELRNFAHWLSSTSDATLERYIAQMFQHDSGGATVTVDDILTLFQDNPVILLLDGLDEIGNDSLRDDVLDSIRATVNRIDQVLRADLRVVLTTRPPAVVGRWNKLDGFTRAVLTPMRPARVTDYVNRWLTAQIPSLDDSERIRNAFDARRSDPHVDALARNPMQLSVLLQFIYLKGEAFPDRRAELYRDYFQIVIDRDVEKSPELRKDRELLEGLHSFLGFRIHGLTEIAETRRSLRRDEIVRLAGSWLQNEGHPSSLADQYFRLGEERFGLIVALSGEGHETTYGFEVQPIQEYFAAAYISNHLANGNAHDVFERLLDRNYWREVALFLAGLRRPNEKADLIARARAVDRRLTSSTTVRNGLEVVLQLLREGVLAQPHHVLLDAMGFVMTVLDPQLLRFHPAPIVLIDALSELGALYPDHFDRTRVMTLLQRHAKSTDYHLLRLLHGLAARVLPHDDYTNIVLSYAGDDPESRAMIRLTCPHQRGAALTSLAVRDGYWDNVSTATWARRLWHAALQHGFVADIRHPAGVQSHLLLHFVAAQFPNMDSKNPVVQIPNVGAPAIWKLQQNIQIMRQLMPEMSESVLPHAPHPERPDSKSLSWSDGYGQNLPVETHDCLRALVEGSDDVVSALMEGDAAAQAEVMFSFYRTIREHLRDPGMAGWLACRCAVEILQYPFGASPSTLDREMLEDVVRTVTEFYNPSKAYDVHIWYDHELFRFGIPLQLRLGAGAEPRLLEAVITDWVYDRVGPEEERYCSWLATSPIPGELMKPLVETCRDDLTRLLEFIGRNGVLLSRGGPRLRVQDVQRVLKICRETEDDAVLRGAANVLVRAKVSRIADPALIVKIMAVAPMSGFTTRVLNPERERRSDHQHRRDDRRFGRRVARLVLEEPDRHPLWVVNRAAAREAETSAHVNAPLFEDCRELLELRSRR